MKFTPRQKMTSEVLESQNMYLQCGQHILVDGIKARFIGYSSKVVWVAYSRRYFSEYVEAFKKSKKVVG